MKNAALLLVSLFFLQNAVAMADLKPTHPGAEWERRDAAAMGLNVEAIEQIGALMEKAQANGVLIHRGYLVAEWTFDEPAEQRFNIQSQTKAITSAVLGLALQEGLISSIDDKVKDTYPGFDAGPYADQVTFRHLVTATSGVASRVSRNLAWGYDYLEPGSVYRYNSDHHQYLALVLTYLFEANLEDLLKERVLDHLQLQDGFEWPTNDGRGRHATSVELPNGETLPVVAGYFNARLSARDLARLGTLYLRGGEWDGKRLLDADYVRESLQPIPYPVMRSREGPPRIKPDDLEWEPTEVPHLRYGLSWRGIVDDDGKTLWYMSGFGGQFNLVLPEAGIVLTKVNDWRSRPTVNLSEFVPFIRDLKE